MLSQKKKYSSQKQKFPPQKKLRTLQKKPTFEDGLDYLGSPVKEALQLQEVRFEAELVEEVLLVRCGIAQLFVCAISAVAFEVLGWTLGPSGCQVDFVRLHFDLDDVIVRLHLLVLNFGFIFQFFDKLNNKNFSQIQESMLT